VVLATLALVIFAFPSKSSVPLVVAAETPVNAGRLTPPENIAVPSRACADTEAGVTPIVCLVSSAENGVSDTAAKPNIYSSASNTILEEALPRFLTAATLPTVNPLAATSILAVIGDIVEADMLVIV